MHSAARANLQKNGTADILFACDHCRVPLVVEKAAAGLILNCRSCGKPTTVPQNTMASRAAQGTTMSSESKRAELERHLKENESQRTEINGYINQLSIQLHRWQLRLQTLNERNKQLSAEMAGLDRAQAGVATAT